ncbi:DUF177 domain-containing protein [Parapontixanthobacter aurantiacus]
MSRSRNANTSEGSEPELPKLPERNEWEYPMKARHLPGGPVVFSAGEAERIALARRFAIPSIERLEAELEFEPDEDHVDAIVAWGTLRAKVTQNCAITAEPFPVSIDEDVRIRFVAEKLQEFDEDEEIELAEDEYDEIAYMGDTFDVGEAIAQSLALAIDPFACGPDADAARQESGLDKPVATGPFAALAGLKKD